MNEYSERQTKMYTKWCMVVATLMMTMLAGCQKFNPITPITTALPITKGISLTATKPLPTATAVPPQGTTTLEIIDASQVSITLPVHGQLLIKACAIAATAIPCILGFLDWENARLIQIYAPVDAWNTSIEWSPDGTKFMCMAGFIGPLSYSFDVFSADGKKLFHHYGYAGWSAGGRYVKAITCEASQLNHGQVTTVYDATSGEEICNVCTGGAVMECQACSHGHSCPSEVSLEHTNPTQTPESPQLNRYQASIEDYWLRIIDTKTGIEGTYIIPGYRIKKIVWSPN